MASFDKILDQELSHEHQGDEIEGGKVGGVIPVESVSFDVLYTETGTEPKGTLFWNNVDGTLDVVLNGVNLAVGQQLYFYGKAQGSITKGALVQFAGVQGDHILMKKCVVAEIQANPTYFIGVASESLTNNDFGYVTYFGFVNDVYTNTPDNGDSANWVAGDILYFSNTTGGLTKTLPTKPNTDIEVAVVVKVQTGNSQTGRILIRPTIYHKLGELSDVSISNPQNNDVIIYNNSRWENTTISSGIAPILDSRYVNVTGDTMTGNLTAPVITLTQTGNATLGSNVVVNGTFDTDTSWTKGTGWGIASGIATKIAGSTEVLSQNIGILQDEVARVTFNYTRSAGTLFVSISGYTHPQSFSSASGSADLYIPAVSTNGLLEFIPDSSFAGTIDNVQAFKITKRTQSINIPSFDTDNLGIGENTLLNTTTGDFNTAVGKNALSIVTTGSRNTALGTNALLRVTRFTDNTAVGYNALANHDVGSGNTAIGAFSMSDNKSNGDGNTAVGFGTLRQNTTGYVNTAIGNAAMTSNTTGNSNQAIGFQCLQNLTTGTHNVAIGRATGNLITSGQQNTLIGSSSFRGANASSCIIIGYDAGSNETNSNRLYIHNSSSTTPLIFGILSGSTAGLIIHSQNVSGKPLVVRAIASQTANLFEVQNSSGTTLASIGSDGKITTSSEIEIDGNLNHDGTNVGLYGVAPVARATTGIAESAFVASSGTTVNDNSTFGGYTLQQVVKALQDIGILT